MALLQRVSGVDVEWSRIVHQSEWHLFHQRELGIRRVVPLDVLLNEHTIVTKGRFCTRLTEFQCAFKLALLFDDLHTDSAASSSGFDDDR